MYSGHYVFAQITKFLPKRYFERLTIKYDDRTRGWSLTHWNHLLVLMFGQQLGCRSLRELTDITVAHANKSFFLGFGKGPVNRPILSKANSIRDYRIFEEFAFTWWLLLNPNALPESLNCMEDSMRLTPQRLISACPFSDGQSSEL